MTGSDGGSPFQDDGSGSRNTLIVIAVVVVFVIAAAAAAIVVVLRQKHSDTSNSAPGTTTTAPSTTTTTTAAPSTTKTVTLPPTSASGAGVNVIVDGAAHTINGQIACVAAGGNINIAVGDTSGSSLGAVLSDADPPEVQTVGLIIGGNPVSYNKGGPGDASATKDGKVYRITGHGLGLPDLPDPMPALKAFEVDVTCP